MLSLFGGAHRALRTLCVAVVMAVLMAAPTGAAATDTATTNVDTTASRTLPVVNGKFSQGTTAWSRVGNRPRVRFDTSLVARGRTARVLARRSAARMGIEHRVSTISSTQLGATYTVGALARTSARMTVSVRARESNASRSRTVEQRATLRAGLWTPLSLSLKAELPNSTMRVSVVALDPKRGDVMRVDDVVVTVTPATLTPTPAPTPAPEPPPAPEPSPTPLPAPTPAAEPATPDRNDFSVNTADLNVGSHHIQGPSIGPAAVDPTTFAALSTTSFATSRTTLFGAPQGYPVGAIQRAERYIQGSDGRALRVTPGQTFTFEYDFTPINMEAINTSRYSWTVISQLIGPSQSGAWRAPIAAVAIKKVDGVPHYFLAGSDEIETTDGVVHKDGGFRIDTGVAASSNTQRHIKFVTTHAKPGVGRSELWIDGRLVAQVAPRYGTAEQPYQVAKYGLYSAMAETPVTRDRWAIFTSMRTFVA